MRLVYKCEHAKNKKYTHHVTALRKIYGFFFLFGGVKNSKVLLFHLYYNM